jgi:hypothetical protein
MPERVQELTRFEAINEAGEVFEVIESSVFAAPNFNSRGSGLGTEKERRFTLADGTRIQRVSWNRFQLAEKLLTRR